MPHQSTEATYYNFQFNLTNSGWGKTMPDFWAGYGAFLLKQKQSCDNFIGENTFAYPKSFKTYADKPMIFTQTENSRGITHIPTHTQRGGEECLVCMEHKSVKTMRWCRICNKGLCPSCYSGCKKGGNNYGKNHGVMKLEAVYGATSEQPKCPNCRTIGCFGYKGIKHTRLYKTDLYTLTAQNINEDRILNTLYKTYVKSKNRLIMDIYDKTMANHLTAKKNENLLKTNIEFLNLQEQAREILEKKQELEEQLRIITNDLQSKNDEITDWCDTKLTNLQSFGFENTHYKTYEGLVNNIIYDKPFWLTYKNPGYLDNDGEIYRHSNFSNSKMNLITHKDSTTGKKWNGNKIVGKCIEDMINIDNRLLGLLEGKIMVDKPAEITSQSIDALSEEEMKGLMAKLQAKLNGGGAK